MKHVFASATLKLTAYYLLIILAVSLLFSLVIYQISLSEASSRISVFQSRVENFSPPNSSNLNFNFLDFRNNQLHETEVSLFIGLLYANIAILVLGGVGSYLLARWTLKPIEAMHDAQSRFTSDASHELRTPLAVMKSELEVALRDKELSKSDMKEMLKSNLEEVNRLSELSTTLLKLSKQDERGLEMSDVSLIDIIQKALSGHSLDSNRVDLKMPKSPVNVLANSSSLQELCIILLDNALRYSPKDSKINVEIASLDKRVALTIQNKGEGIKQDDLPHVFERFYRADKSRTNGDAQGYGLGLSLAKKIVDLHRGTIDITSEPGKVTSVKVELLKV